MDYTKMFKEILNKALKDIDASSDLSSLNEVRNCYLSRKGELSVMMNEIAKASDKKAFGQAYNEARKILEEALSAKSEKFAEIERDKKLKEESIDITLPGSTETCGSMNPFYRVIEDIEEVFVGMGYKVEDGPEVEDDHHNFELLNIPKDHPARDMQDSFYIDSTLLMRSHTSPVQARVMEKAKGKPIKIICPGKTYRRDDDDMTHSHQFAQVEGLVIDRGISMGNLKATLELFAKKMFGEDRKIRLRSSFFPFTEPSVEVDISCFKCGGKGCATCKGTGWIEILGAGMVHPNVLKMNGYDPEVYSGFAFGVGIERVAMLKYGIDDIRRFYQNDVRFLHEFKKSVED
jgi:phenylalanyl-tRNA synthetase alpha chain